MKIHDLHDTDRVDERHPIYGQLAEETAAFMVFVMLDQYLNSVALPTLHVALGPS